MLESNTPFFMGIIETPFGSFDVPLFNWSNNLDNPDWRLMNGESAQGTIIDHRVSDIHDGESFSEWWNRVFGGGSGGLGFMQILGIALAIFLLILLFPVFVLVFKVVFGIVALVPKPRKKQKQPKQNYHYDSDGVSSYDMKICNRCGYPYARCVCGSDYYERNRGGK
jgi:hypothetical protein